MSNTINVTTALFDAKIASNEVTYLRGNAIKLSNQAPLFHNHQAEGFHYAYPLVQYKRIHGHAAITGINEGGRALMEMIAGGMPQYLQIGRRSALTGDIQIHTQQVDLESEQQPGTYKISQWLPLNQHNYPLYQQKKGLVERLTTLEGILVANILSFAKGVGIHLEKKVECHILDIEQHEPVSYKQIELLSFNALFECNIPLPEYIGLGKSASLGNGIIQRMNKQ
jgi:hypothetical protein